MKLIHRFAALLSRPFRGLERMLYHEVFIKRVPIWATAAHRLPETAEARDIALEACERLDLDPDTHGHILYLSLSACLCKDNSAVCFLKEAVRRFPDTPPTAVN